MVTSSAPNAPIRLLIELESVDPVAGSVQSDAGEIHRFAGWIGVPFTVFCIAQNSWSA